MTTSKGNTHHDHTADPAHAADDAHGKANRQFKESYKQYYSNPQTVANLLTTMDTQAGASPELVDAFDLASVAQVPEHIVPREVQERIGGCLWQVRFRKSLPEYDPSPTHAMLILVFEETLDPAIMANKMSGHIDALWSAILQSRGDEPDEPPPLLMPILKVVERERWSHPPDTTMRGTLADDSD